jgi:hypothetical protein
VLAENSYTGKVMKEKAMNQTRLLGIILGVVGLGVALIAGLWLASQVSAGALTSGGAIVGAAFAFIPVALLLGFGVYFFNRGAIEVLDETMMQKQRRLLDIVKSRGKVNVSELAIEMQLTADAVRDMVHQLVGLQVFSGYVNWQDGVLYSDEAANLRELNNCRNCGGEITLVGRGVIACRFCGTEYFLP